jgi:hypothetical protein
MQPTPISQRGIDKLAIVVDVAQLLAFIKYLIILNSPWRP